MALSQWLCKGGGPQDWELAGCALPSSPLAAEVKLDRACAEGEEPGSCIPPLNNDLFILLAHTEKTGIGENVAPQIVFGLS